MTPMHNRQKVTLGDLAFQHLIYDRSGTGSRVIKFTGI